MVSGRYRDVWKTFIPDHKLAAYNQMLNSGLISDPYVEYDRTNKVTIVEYSSEIPRDMVLEELRQRSIRPGGAKDAV